MFPDPPFFCTSEILNKNKRDGNSFASVSCLHHGKGAVETFSHHFGHLLGEPVSQGTSFLNAKKKIKVKSEKHQWMH